MDKSSILVPYGWKRCIQNKGKNCTVHYTSPSNVILSSVAEVCQYLERDDTCKCGLKCPILVPKVFSFNPEVSSFQVSKKEWILRRRKQPADKCIQWNNLAKQLLCRKSCSSPSSAPPAKLIIRRKGGRLTSVIPSDTEEVTTAKTSPEPAQVINDSFLPVKSEASVREKEKGKEPSKSTTSSPFKLQWIPTEEQTIKTDLPDLGNISSPPAPSILQSTTDSTQRPEPVSAFPTLPTKPDASVPFGIPVKFDNTTASFNYPLPTLPPSHQHSNNENNDWLPATCATYKGNSVFYNDDSNNRVFGEYRMGGTSNEPQHVHMWNQQQQQQIYPQQNLAQNKLWPTNTQRFPMQSNQQFPLEFSKPFRQMLPKTGQLLPSKYQNYSMNVSGFHGQQQQVLPVDKQDGFHQHQSYPNSSSANQWSIYSGNNMPVQKNKFAAKPTDDNVIHRQRRQPRSKKAPKAKPQCASLSQSALDILDTLSEKCRKDTKVADARKVQHFHGGSEQQQPAVGGEVREENVQSTDEIVDNVASSIYQNSPELKGAFKSDEEEVSDASMDKVMTTSSEAAKPVSTCDNLLTCVPISEQQSNSVQPPVPVTESINSIIKADALTENKTQTSDGIIHSIDSTATSSESPERRNVKLRMLAASDSTDQKHVDDVPSCSHRKASEHSHDDDLCVSGDTMPEARKNHSVNDESWLDTNVDPKSVVAIEKLVKTIMKQNTETIASKPINDERNNPHLKDMIEQCLHLQNEILEKVKNIKKPEDEVMVCDSSSKQEEDNEQNAQGLQVAIVSSSVKAVDKTLDESIVESLNEDSGEDFNDSEDENCDIRRRLRSGQIQKQEPTGVNSGHKNLKCNEEGIERNKEKAVNLRNKAAPSSSSSKHDELKSHKSFECGDLIWGQMRGYPSWPGKIVSSNDVRCIQQRTPLVEGKVWVKWFGDQTFAQMNPLDLKSLNEGLDYYTKAKKKCRTRKKTNNRLEHAIQEAVDELEMQQILSKKSPS